METRRLNYFIMKPKKDKTLVYLYLSYHKSTKDGKEQNGSKYIGKVSIDDPRVKLLTMKEEIKEKIQQFVVRDGLKFNIVKV